jgi:hypothetical protein
MLLRLRIVIQKSRMDSSDETELSHACGFVFTQC